MKTHSDLIIFYIFIILFFLVIYLQINFIPDYFPSDYNFIIVLLSFCWVIWIFGKKAIDLNLNTENNNNFNNTLSIIFTSSIVTLSLYLTFNQPIFGYDFRYFEFVNIILFNIWLLKYWIILLTITIWILLIYNNKEKINEIIMFTEKEKLQTQEKRFLFKEKHNIISKIPIIWRVINYISSDDLTLVWISVIFGFFIVNYLFIKNFNILPDESFHLFAAYWIWDYLLPNIGNNLLYLRWIIVSYFVFVFNYFVQDPEYALRLPSLLISIITLFVILNTKLLNTKGKIITLILFSVNIFFIQNATYWRFYVYQILVNLLFFLTLISIENTNKLSFKDHLLLAIFPIISIFISELYLYVFMSYWLFLLFMLKGRIFHRKHFILWLFVSILVAIKILIIKDIVLLDPVLISLKPTWIATTESNFVMYVLNELSANVYFVNLFFNELAFIFIFTILWWLILYKKNKISMSFVYLYIFLISITTIKNQPYTLSFFIWVYLFLSGIWIYYIYKIIWNKIILVCWIIWFWLFQSVDYFKNLHIGWTPPPLMYISPAIRIHNDFQSVSEYVNNLKYDKNETLLISAYWISLPHRTYLKQDLDYILWWYYRMFREDNEWNYYELFTKLKSINNILDLQVLNKDKDLIIITSYTSTNLFKNINWTVIKHIPDDMIRFLDSNWKNVKYIGKDNVSKVYLFKKWEITWL